VAVPSRPPFEAKLCCSANRPLLCATRTNSLNGQLGLFKLKSRRQRQRETGLQLFQAEDLAAAGAVKMRAAVFGGDGVEAPEPVLAFDLVRQTLRHQPIEHAVERDAIKIRALLTRVPRSSRRLRAGRGWRIALA
jgi:hypothetical protein